jgi:hypothetical protein
MGTGVGVSSVTIAGASPETCIGYGAAIGSSSKTAIGSGVIGGSSEEAMIVRVRSVGGISCGGVCKVSDSQGVAADGLSKKVGKGSLEMSESGRESGIVDGITTGVGAESVSENAVEGLSLTVVSAVVGSGEISVIEGLVGSSVMKCGEVVGEESSEGLLLLLGVAHDEDASVSELDVVSSETGVEGSSVGSSVEGVGDCERVMEESWSWLSIALEGTTPLAAEVEFLREEKNDGKQVTSTSNVGFGIAWIGGT